ncbi:MAG: hypothetical protein ACOC8H_00825 [bacterium]
MKLNTVVKLADGRVGTICYHNLDGTGGVWGRHKFVMPPAGFGPELPTPDFLLREYDEGLLDRLTSGPNAFKATLELVGREFEVLDGEADKEADDGRSDVC